MSRELFSSLPQVIFKEAREIRTLTSPHRPSPTSEIRSLSPLHLPDARVPVQYLIDMGFKPALARRISSVYVDLISQFKQVLESYFRRIIHGGCHLHPEYYRNIFIVQYKNTIQTWESRIMSTAWVWLLQARVLPAIFGPQHIDVRVDTVTKAQILSRLGLKATSFIMSDMNQTAKTVDLLEEESKTKDSSAKPLCVSSSPPPISMTTPTRDPFFLKMSSTSFPACYPPPRNEVYDLHRRDFVTSFTRATAVQTEKKPLTTCDTDMLSVISLIDRMSLSSLHAGTRTQVPPKGLPRIPKSNKSDPLPPVLSPIVVDALSPCCQPQPGLTSTAKRTLGPRKRRIAPLPTPRAKSPTSFNPHSSATGRSSFNAVSSRSAASCAPSIQASSGVSGVRSNPPAHDPAETSGPSTLKPVVTKRKTIPLPRRPQVTSSSRQSPTLPGWDVPSHTVSRTPSLVSDTSSGIESASSSDELDTPPSTPPSLHALSVCRMPENAAVPLTSNKLKLSRRPSLRDSALPNLRKQGIHILTKGDVGRRERPLTFTFGA